MSLFQLFHHRGVQFVEELLVDGIELFLGLLLMFLDGLAEPFT